MSTNPVLIPLRKAGEASKPRRHQFIEKTLCQLETEGFALTPKSVPHASVRPSSDDLKETIKMLDTAINNTRKHLVAIREQIAKYTTEKVRVLSHKDYSTTKKKELVSMLDAEILRLTIKKNEIKKIFVEQAERKISLINQCMKEMELEM